MTPSSTWGNIIAVIDPLAKNIDWDAVARYYDAYMRTDLDVPYFLDRADSVGDPFLELMCGTGRITLPLLEAGHHGTAVDSSPQQLARLREKLAHRRLSAEIVESDVRAVALNRQFRLVFVGLHSFSELLGHEARRLAMTTIRPHIAAGGTFIVTLHNPPGRVAALHSEWRTFGTFPLDAEHEVEVGSRWALEPHGTRVSGMLRYHELSSDGSCTRELIVPILFDLVTLEEMKSLARGVGLRIGKILGDYQYAPFDPASSPFIIVEMHP